AAAAARPQRLSPGNTGVLRETLLRAVQRELMSDVPLGVFTSGGLDSSLLVAAAARAIPGERIHTYAIRFTEPGYDESPYAEAVTHQIASVHHVVTADDESLGRALEVVSRSLAVCEGGSLGRRGWGGAGRARCTGSGRGGGSCRRGRREERRGAPAPRGDPSEQRAASSPGRASTCASGGCPRPWPAG